MMTPELRQTITVRVRYAKTDKRCGLSRETTGVVRNRPLRTAARAVGQNYRDLEASGIGLPVIEAHCEYKSPAAMTMSGGKTSGKDAVAGTRRVRVRDQPRSDATVNAVARTVHAAVDTNGRTVPAADYIRELLE